MLATLKNIYDICTTDGFAGKYFFNNLGTTMGYVVMIAGILATIICSYLLGSINFAIIISGKSYKQDIRNFGSKNAGMTNMMRTYGKKAAALTLLGDALKAIVACLVGYVLLGQLGVNIAGLCCILGHVFPIFYRFKGGKGVVTAAASILMCNWMVFLILLAIFVIIVLVTRYISLGSITCILLYPFVLHTFAMVAVGETSPYILLTVIMAIVIVCKHWTNIQRLRNRTESKFSFKKSVKAPEKSKEDAQ